MTQGRSRGGRSHPGQARHNGTRCVRGHRHPDRNRGRCQEQEPRCGDLKASMTVEHAEPGSALDDRLRQEQAQAMATQNTPLQVVNPLTQQVYVLVPEKVYELTCRIVSVPNRAGWDNPADDDLIRVIQPRRQPGSPPAPRETSSSAGGAS